MKQSACRITAAFTVALAAFLSACSGGSTSADALAPIDASKLPSCSPVSGRSWIPVPSQFDKEAIAAALHVTPSVVAEGSLGNVDCNEGATIEQITEGYLVSVPKKGACLMVGTGEEPLPKVPQRLYR
jgi:hypothetical protein